MSAYNADIRCFVAVKFSDEFIEEFQRLEKLLSATGLFTGKPTPRDNLHLTLKFIGDTPPDKLEQMIKLLSSVRCDPVAVTIRDVGVFTERFIKIIWLGIDGLQALSYSIDSALDGLISKEGEFLGHVTLFRVKNVAAKWALLDLIRSIKPNQMKAMISSFYLMKSTLTDSGPIYEELAVFPLG